MRAACEDHVAAMRLLLEHGAKTDLQDNVILIIIFLNGGILEGHGFRARYACPTDQFY